MQNNSTVFVLDKNEQSREIIKSFVSDLEFINEIKLYEDYKKGYEDIKQASSPIVIMDISEELPELQEVAENLKLCTSKIIITSVNYSTNTIIRALRMGAKEFLPKPVLKDDLIRVLTMLASIAPEEENSQSKITISYLSISFNTASLICPVIGHLQSFEPTNHDTIISTFSSSETTISSIAHSTNSCFDIPSGMPVLYSCFPLLMP